GGVEEGEVEAEVVADEHGAADELGQAGEHGRGRRRGAQVLVADAGERGDGRVDGRGGADERPERAEQLAAPVAGGADLGDVARPRRPARRLQVDGAEGHLVQGRGRVVDAAAHRPNDSRTPVRTRDGYGATGPPAGSRPARSGSVGSGTWPTDTAAPPAAT